MQNTNLLKNPAEKSSSLHVAIIMDGNGRWATQRGQPRLMGHRKGAERAKEIVAAAPSLGITHLTLFAFSTENWKRSTKEVIGLMHLFSTYIRNEASRLSAAEVRMQFIGDRRRLNTRLRDLMSWIEVHTQANRKLTLTVAINYGGRDELLRAIQQMIASTKCTASAKLVEANFSNYLDTNNLPDPDLVVRTSGESRISNFLLWQSAHSVYEFTPTLWPDFDREEMARILNKFKTGARENLSLY